MKRQLSRLQHILISGLALSLFLVITNWSDDPLKLARTFNKKHMNLETRQGFNNNSNKGMLMEASKGFNIKNKHLRWLTYKKLCQNFTHVIGNDSEDADSFTFGNLPKFPNVTLMALMNWPFYEVVPVLELLYRPFFKDIIYCSPPPLTQNENQTFHHVKNTWNITAFHIFPKGGGLNYICIEAAKNISDGTEDGFLFLADDTFFPIRNGKTFYLLVSFRHF